MVDELNFLCRIGLLLTLALYQLCILTDKFSLLGDAVDSLIFYLSIKNQTAALTEDSELELQIKQLDFDKIEGLYNAVSAKIKKGLDRAQDETELKRQDTLFVEFMKSWFKYTSTISLFDMVFLHGIKVISGGNKNQNQLTVFKPSEIVSILDE